MRTCACNSRIEKAAEAIVAPKSAVIDGSWAHCQSNPAVPGALRGGLHVPCAPSPLRLATSPWGGARQDAPRRPPLGGTCMCTLAQVSAGACVQTEVRRQRRHRVDRHRALHGLHNSDWGPEKRFTIRKRKTVNSGSERGARFPLQNTVCVHPSMRDHDISRGQEA